VVNASLIIAGGMGIVRKTNPGLLKNNLCHDKKILTKNWAKSLLSRMGYVKSRGTTTAKINLKNFDNLRENFLEEI